MKRALATGKWFFLLASALALAIASVVATGALLAASLTCFVIASATHDRGRS